MAEYIERGKALDALLYRLCGTGCQSAAMSEIEMLHTADVTPVIRCEKCRRCKPENNRLFCDVHGEYTTPDYFCASATPDKEATE